MGMFHSVAIIINSWEGYLDYHRGLPGGMRGPSTTPRPPAQYWDSPAQGSTARKKNPITIGSEKQQGLHPH